MAESGVKRASRTFTVYERPTCGAVRMIPYPAPHNLWCDGACSHPRASLAAVTVVPLDDVVEALREKAASDAWIRTATNEAADFIAREFGGVS